MKIKAEKKISKVKKMESESSEDEETATPVGQKNLVLANNVSQSDSDAEGTEDEPMNEEPEKVNDKQLTLFIGNLPKTTSARNVKSMFKQYGTIKTVRFRTEDGQKIFFKKDKSLVKSLNCYVRFSAKEEMEKACEMNGHVVGTSRIRVCPVNTKQIGAVQSTVFVGNIYKGTTDDELYQFFSKVGEIEYIRQIPNKYIAYVCFKKGVSIKKALKLDQEKLNNRPLRIMNVDVRRNNVKLNKKGNVVKRNKLPKSQTAGVKSEKAQENGTGEFHGHVAGEKKKKKSFNFGKGSEKSKKILAKKLKAAKSMTKKQ